MGDNARDAVRDTPSDADDAIAGADAVDGGDAILMQPLDGVNADAVVVVVARSVPDENYYYYYYYYY